MKKRKLTCLLLCSLVFSGTLNGCGKESVSDSKSKENSEIIETTQSTVETDAIQTTTEIPTEIATEEQSNFDFFKILESTYICGQQLTYPLTWGQFGDDFIIVEDGASSLTGSEKVSCLVNYKGHTLGCFSFKGCENVNDITSDTEIYMVAIKNLDMENFEVPKIVVNGLEIYDSHDDIYNALGDDYKISDNEKIVTYRNEKKQQFSFGFSIPDDDDKLISVRIILSN